MNGPAIAQLLMERRATELPASALANVLNDLMWVLADNGSEILAVQRSWLEQTSDEFQAEVALNMSEALPYDTVDELKLRCTKIVQVWPELADLALRLISHWEAELSKRT